jgi:hypothetical protein
VKEPIAWEQPHAANARAFYRHIIRLSRTHPAFANADLHAVPTTASNDVIAYRRNDVIVLVNTRPRAIDVTVMDVALKGKRDLLYHRVQTDNTVQLPGYGAVILE